ncbi:6-phospho-beta-glucosidase [Cohnella suwonensis]|uniref:6-phospho-beta-glucosidase n=1 Tax=Cohnella suwonensis TaxID=696072 RepID=A0ABW0LVP0_9BACL
MNGGLKIAVVGGGSSYTPEIVEGFINRYEELPVRELWLVDIEAGKEKLEIVGQLAKRMIERSRLPIRLHLTLDRRAALEGADFVTTQLRVGQLEARGWDERIPLAYGVIGQETTGPGGMMKAFRTIPVLLDICRDLEELSPNAWLLNFTNPAGMVTEAINKYAKIRTIGLCNAPIGFRKKMSKRFGRPVREILPEFVGINHLHWITSVYVGGEDRLPELLREAEGNGSSSPANIPALDWDPAFLQALGAIPSSYLRYYYMKDRMLRDQFEALEEKGTRADEVLRVEKELFGIYRNPGLSSKPPQLELRGGAYYSEAAVDLIHSIHNDVRDIQTVNVRNGRTIEFLEPDAVIETNCVITAQGPIPLPPSRVPAAAKGLLHAVKTYESLAVNAAAQGDESAALLAICAHPLVPSVETGRNLLKALMERNRNFLPQFGPAPSSRPSDGR